MFCLKDMFNNCSLWIFCRIISSVVWVFIARWLRVNPGLVPDPTLTCNRLAIKSHTTLILEHTSMRLLNFHILQLCEYWCILSLDALIFLSLSISLFLLLSRAWLFPFLRFHEIFIFSVLRILTSILSLKRDVRYLPIRLILLCIKPPSCMILHVWHACRGLLLLNYL